MANLPAITVKKPLATRSKNIMPRHVRYVMRGHRRVPVMINPLKPRRIRPKIQAIQPRPVHWTEVLKRDTGVLDGKTLKDGRIVRREQHTVDEQEVLELVESWPDRNEEDWMETYIREPLKTLNEEIAAQEIEAADVDKRIKKIAEDATSVLEDDLSDAPVNISYSGDHIGMIGHYREYENEGFDYIWHGNIGGGHYEVTADPDTWEEIIDDDALAWSEDTENLGKMWKKLKEILDRRGIRWAVTTARSSNIFWSPIKIFVDKGMKKEIAHLVAQLKRKYRDPGLKAATLNPLHDSMKQALKSSSKDQIMDMVNRVSGKDSEAAELAKQAIKDIERGGK